MSQELSREVSNYSDLRIANILQQKNFYPETVVNAARHTAVNRGIFDEEQLNLMEQYPAIKKYIRAKIDAGLAEEDILTQIKDIFGIDDQNGSMLINEVCRLRSIAIESPGNGLEEIDRKYIYVGGFILFFLIKLIFLAALRH